MAQRIFQSFRRIPAHLASLRKKPDAQEVHGVSHKINVCADYGFPAKPISIAYDSVLDLLALLTRDGNLYVYGRPGVVFTGTHTAEAEFIQVLFFNGGHRLLTLTDSDDIFLWELSTTGRSNVRLTQVARLSNATAGLRTIGINGSSSATSSFPESPIHITSICCCSDNRSFFIGTDHGWVSSVRLNTPSKTVSKDFEYLIAPTSNDAITPSRILESISPNRRQRFSLDAVVVLSERPGFPGQLLIGYSSSISLIFDLRADRVVALLPWKHGLESAAWCGGNGRPLRVESNTYPPHFGMRLLTAHSDGSLGVWNLKDIGYMPVTSSPNPEPPTLTMEDPPMMPYGPFPCKMINKVFWLPSLHGGITAFSGGMPRSNYGERHTVSLLRGSNLDRAASANVAAARSAAALDDEDDEEDVMDPVPNTPMHVFDPDTAEHVCFDLPSRLVDLIPIGPVSGPTQMLLLLCEEEMVAVDLLTPGWPFMRPPYLACLHTTAVTAYSLSTQVNPHLLARLEAAGACYGPEGRFGRGSAIASSPHTPSWSTRPWPIRGGEASVSGTRLSVSSLQNDGARFTDDLLLTGHEDGSVTFWRLSAGGCARRVYTLHTAVLFDGDFGLITQNHSGDSDGDDGDSWPPFRQAGVFDPFMDDGRAAVQLVRLVDNTLAVGGAAGQITVWQFLDFAPPLSPVCATIKSELPGFQWKGFAQLKLRNRTEDDAIVMANQQQDRKPPAEMQAIGIVLVQPPARCSALSLTELHCAPSGSDPNGPVSLLNPPGVIIALGTPHGYSVAYMPPAKPPPSPISGSTSWEPVVPKILITESTLPDNVDALQEAAAGEGWARRRTRELKKSLRDSFRRLKRVRSTKATGESTVPAGGTNVSRQGVRRTVTQNNRATGRTVDTGPLDDVDIRTRGNERPDPLATMSIEREICDRPLDSANIAIVSGFLFGPPLFKFHSSSTHATASSIPHRPIGSLFVGTKAGVVKAYALFGDRDLQSNDPPSQCRLQLAKQLLLQHRAPILHLRLVDMKLCYPLSPFGLHTNSRSPSAPLNLLVVSEEQVRLFQLPTLRLRYKARITAKDGFRIKAGSVVSFRAGGKVHGSQNRIGEDLACGDADRSIVSTTSTPAHQSASTAIQGDTSASEFAFVFTNVGGQTVVLNMPHLTRRDTFGLLDSNDVVAISSVLFSEPACSGPPQASSVIAPSLGLYQLAAGQLTLFDVIRTGQRASLLGASYRPIYRMPVPRMATSSPATASSHWPTMVSNGSTTADSSGYSSRAGYNHHLPPPMPPYGRAAGSAGTGGYPFTTAASNGCSMSYAGSQVNSSMLSNTLSDSVRDCFTPPSGSSFVSEHQYTDRRQVT